MLLNPYILHDVFYSWSRIHLQLAFTSANEVLDRAKILLVDSYTLFEFPSNK